MDNLFVIMAIFSSFAVKDAFQHRVLYYGVLGALVLRLIFVAAGRSHHRQTMMRTQKRTTSVTECSKTIGTSAGAPLQDGKKSEHHVLLLVAFGRRRKQKRPSGNMCREGLTHLVKA